VRRLTTVTVWLGCLVALLATGCDYRRAVLQNLDWGAEGMVQSILTHGDLRGASTWVTQSLINALIYGHQ